MDKTKIKLRESCDLGEGKTKLSFSGRIRAKFPISTIKLLSNDTEQEESDSDSSGDASFVFGEDGSVEERAKMGHWRECSGKYQREFRFYLAMPAKIQAQDSENGTK